MTCFDLHCHSTASDGRLSPSELVARAAVQGVEVLALTDHDTVAGLDEARCAAHQCGICLVDGIEFSSLWGGRGIHVVGLKLKLDSPELQAALDSQAQARLQRAQTIADKLAKLGFSGALDGAQRLAGGAAIGRPHFAQYLLECGAVKSINEAFKKYLGAGKPGDVKQLWPDTAEVVQWIVESGGIAVLAHPHKYKMTRTKLCALSADFREAGGQGFEVVSGVMPPGVADSMAQIAEQHQLYASCGSDFHFASQWQELGKFSPLPKRCRPVWELF